MKGRAVLAGLVSAIFLAGGTAGAGLLVVLRKPVQTRPPEVKPPLVRAAIVRATDARLHAIVHGTVTPRTESLLVSQVAGRVLETAPAFAQGGFFEAGDTLVRIDPRDFELAASQAEARLAEARLRLAREEAEAALAAEEWNKFGRGDPDPLALRKPQLAEARAAVVAAEAALEMARLNLERTAVRAPFAGRVWEKHVDVGQHVSPGARLARIYAVDYAEIRLPIPLDQLEHLDLPLDFRGDASRAEGPEVEIRARIGGANHVWHGRIVRTEAEIDPATRMLRAVARVDNPYGRGTEQAAARPPLMVGLFVQATILGRSAPGVFRLPRGVLRSGNRVLAIDAEDRIRFRTVEIAAFQREEVLIRAGLQEGDRVCLSPIEIATEGMKVRVQLEGER